MNGANEHYYTTNPVIIYSLHDQKANLERGNSSQCIIQKKAPESRKCSVQKLKQSMRLCFHTFPFLLHWVDIADHATSRYCMLCHGHMYSALFRALHWIKQALEHDIMNNNLLLFM